MKIGILFFVLASLLKISVANAAINIDTVLVGDAGNPNDYTGYGQVNYNYHIGTYEVTNAQYAIFLNSVAKTDKYGLYSPGMASSYGVVGITRSGSSGNYNYVATSPDTPVSYVSFWDAARFANWLTTGDTETGVYNLEMIVYNRGPFTYTRWLLPTRDATAWANGGVAVASEDEWYKAAYYSGSPTGANGSGYWLYPTQSNNITINDANYGAGSGVPDVVNNVTAVGSYGSNSGYYGTFDQGGNVREWNDRKLYESNGNFFYEDDYYRQRGGSFYSGTHELESSLGSNSSQPEYQAVGLGFRIVSLEPIAIPESSTYATIFGGLGFLIALLRQNLRRSI